MNKPKCMITVDVEALTMRAASNHVNTLIYGRVDGKEYGIGRMMDIADKHHVKMTFFLDFAEYELYGDDILEVGRYIKSRGHDLQVHCHYDLLEKIVGKKSWVSIEENYYSWYNDDEDSRKIVDYVTDKYVQCTGKMPLAYRGGEYRFGTSVLKAIKEKGYIADLSYNYVRPQMLSVNKQFKYENGLLELPIGIMPNRKPLNFNYTTLTPESKDDYDRILDDYKHLFDEYYDYYGQDAVATFLMHSWSFMHKRDRFTSVGYIDTPNDVMVEFYDRFLETMKDKVDFVSVSQVIDSIDKEPLKTADFKAVFKAPLSASNLIKISDYINEKANGRQVIIWGKGWMESTVFQTVNLHKSLNTVYYISNDADKKPMWRGKPVHKFSEVTLDPKRDYVFVLAQPTFPEIRDSLRELGFKEYEDFFDIQKKVPGERSNGIQEKVKYTCPICGGNVFETYNSDKLRRCSNCGSVERTRTMVKLFNENLNRDLSACNILHISPSRAERMIFNKFNAKVTTVDIRPECKTDLVADICNMPEIASESYDIVFANCVMNHVYDDEMALSEMNRVLKKDGIAIIYAMESGTLKNTVSDTPTDWYGQANFEKYRIGTFRHYGEVDFTAQLKRHFSYVKCFEKYDDVTDSSCKWYICGSK